MASGDNELIWQANPSWRGMTGWYVKYTLGAAVVALIIYAAARYGDLMSPFVAGLLILTCFGLVFGLGYLKRHTTLYIITRRYVSEKSGILNTRSEQAPIEQITNITVDRSLVERIMGIGRINIDTANDRVDTLDWWGVHDPYKIESIIDRLKIERAESRLARRPARENADPTDDELESWLSVD